MIREKIHALSNFVVHFTNVQSVCVLRKAAGACAPGARMKGERMGDRHKMKILFVVSHKFIYICVYVNTKRVASQC